MEGNCNDPYEQQLLAVFESCQIEGESGLDENGLRSLCDKLQLEERGKELISCLLERTPSKKSVSFYEFRDGLLALLGSAQDGISNYSDREFPNDSLQNLNSTRLATKKYGRRSKPNDQNADLVDFQHPHLDGARNEIWRGIDGLLNQDIKIDEQRLREIWAKINLGSDRSELPIVSQYIGVPMLPKQSVEQIFEKLDKDHDGRISLDEFLLIFRNPKTLQEQLGSAWTPGSRNDIMKQDCEKDSIQIRGPHHTGFARSSTVVDMWEVAGVPDAGTLLSELGFSNPDVSLTELTNVLCEELKSLRDESDNRVMGTHISLLKAALVLYQEEVRSLNTFVEHLGGERDKLRGDIVDANQRASLLAQEVDEHHICLEKSSQNQIKQLELKNAEIVKDLTNQLTAERESNVATLKLMDQRLQTLQQEDQRIRTELTTVLSENHTLETENQHLSEHVSKLRLSNNQLQMQIQTLAAEHDEVENVEAKENEVLVSLLDRIKRLQSDNAQLRDQNDELTSELEIVKNRDLDLKNSGVTVENDAKVLTVRVAELEELLQSKTLRTENASAGTMNSITSMETNQQLSQLKDLLGKIIKDLTHIVTEKKNDCTLENCLMKNKILEVICGLDMNVANYCSGKEADSVTSLANELKAEGEQRATESRRDFVTSKSDKGKIDKKTTVGDDIVQNIDKNFNNLDTKSISKNKMTSLRDYPPRRDENISDQSKIEKEKSNVFYNLRESSTNEKSDVNKCNNTKDYKEFDRITEILQEVEEKHVSEKKQLSDRCMELERSLDLLRTEYEQCEDYWAGKLEEERQLFEQEQRISDDKFSDLIAKMAEYEEQFGPGDKSRTDGRLSPIEERFNLEQQYTQLEEEFSDWKCEAENALIKRDKEIHDLREKLQNDKLLLTRDCSVQCPDNADIQANPAPVNFVTPLTPNASEEFAPPKLSYLPSSSLPLTNSTLCEDDHRIFSEPFKLKHFSESENANGEVGLSLGARTTPCLHGCNCQQIQSYSVTEDLCRGHREELRRLHQLKINIDGECNALMKQKEQLMQEILKLQSLRTISCSCAQIDAGEQACRIDLNVLQALNARLQSQEQKCRHFQVVIKQQQQHTDRILHQTWKQHRNEISDLQFFLRGTQEKLQQQIQAYKEQADRLARADMLAKDLYLENAYLMASVERLEQHCHVLTQYSTESTSV